MNPSRINWKLSKFDFTTSIRSIEDFGKEKIDANFFIDPQDYEIIFKLLIWILQDQENCKRFNIALHKGIILSGPTGCGKTSLMRILGVLAPPHLRFLVKPSRNICYEFTDFGYSVIKKYTKHKQLALCLDDLGTELPIRYFGTEVNVIREVLLSRYDKFITDGQITHATTNLSSSELGKIYGSRIRSRFKEMFNLISFHPDTPDKRK